MYNNLTLYYLEQLGIRPWVNKENYLATTKSESTIKLIIVLAKKTNEKARYLLGKMLAYLNLPEHQFLIINEEDKPGQACSNLVALWSLGPISNEIINQFSTKKIIASSHLNEVINHPALKKKILIDLADIQNILQR